MPRTAHPCLEPRHPPGADRGTPSPAPAPALSTAVPCVPCSRPSPPPDSRTPTQRLLSTSSARPGAKLRDAGKAVSRGAQAPALPPPRRGCHHPRPPARRGHPKGAPPCRQHSRHRVPRPHPWKRLQAILCLSFPSCYIQGSVSLGCWVTPAPHPKAGKRGSRFHPASTPALGNTGPLELQPNPRTPAPAAAPGPHGSPSPQARC